VKTVCDGKADEDGTGCKFARYLGDNCYDIGVIRPDIFRRASPVEYSDHFEQWTMPASTQTQSYSKTFTARALNAVASPQRGPAWQRGQLHRTRVS
jgi:hypothetical protein